MSSTFITLFFAFLLTVLIQQPIDKLVYMFLTSDIEYDTPANASNEGSE